MLRFLPLLLCCFFSVTLNAQVQTHNVYFDVDKHEIKDQEQKRLSTFLESLNIDQIESVKISAHTDSDASDDYNIELSLRRENSVADALIKKGVSVQITREHHGEAKPVNPNASPEQKAKNRRVEITVVTKSDGIKDLYALLEQKKQEFCISNDRDTVLLLDQGTLVHFPKNAFGANISGCVTILAKEVYKKSDMIMENLSTTSNGQMLESAGMIYLEARDQSGNELNLVKAAAIFMPTDTVRDDMEIFNGQRDPHSDIMNWVQNNTSGLSGVDPSLFVWCASQLRSSAPQIIDSTVCVRCRMFCRVKRIGLAFKGAKDIEVKKENRRFRECQKDLRLTKLETQTKYEYGASVPIIDPQCEALDSVFKRYGVKDYEGLLLTMNKELMDSLGVTSLKELRAVQEAQRLENIRENGNKGVSELQFYAFNTMKLRWINCDAFGNLQVALIPMQTDLWDDGTTDCKAIFKSVNGVMPSYGSPYSFMYIPEKQSVYLLGLKFKDKQAYIAIQNTETKLIADKFTFKPVTLDELKSELKKLDL